MKNKKEKVRQGGARLKEGVGLLEVVAGVWKGLYSNGAISAR